ncbi:FecR family protein [Cyclobacterium xiamenense]|uniref:FecR family protein n=1 Tax=Cyclobacterium xiamenense TaxID=1297121 RepID=UPI0035D0C26B
MDKAIIARFLNGTATEEEVERVMQWLEQAGGREHLEDLFADTWEQESLYLQDDLRKRKLFERINRALNSPVPEPKKTQKIRVPAFLRAAATWMLLIGLLYLALRVIWENQQRTTPQTSSIQWIEKNVLPGQKLFLELPDHTKVWVNANSAIRFPSAFSSDFRDVYLDGEAFFEVQKESARPFRVFAGGITTEVLGTRFNINVQEEKTELALLEGRVRVNISQDQENKRVLVPGQQAIFYPHTADSLRVSGITRENAFLWKERVIYFDNQRFASILPMLEDWYGVSFRYAPPLKIGERRVSGTFSNDNLENLLIGLGFTLDFTFEFQNDLVTLYPE